jgi:hypothetical protein
VLGRRGFPVPARNTFAGSDGLPVSLRPPAGGVDGSRLTMWRGQVLPYLRRLTLSVANEVGP